MSSKQLSFDDVKFTEGLPNNIINFEDFVEKNNALFEKQYFNFIYDTTAHLFDNPETIIINNLREFPEKIL